MTKTVLITGASSGLGYEMAQQFADKGYNLALCARRVDKLEQLKCAIEAQHPLVNIAIKSLDVNNHQRVFEVFQEFQQYFGTLDRIIVNAGMGKGASVGTGYFEANKQTAMTNFVAALAQCEAAMEIFRAQNHGHLVTISSISSVRGFRRALTVYAATKAGLSVLTEGIRADVLHLPIKVSAIYPGFIRSEINEKVKTAPFMVDTKTGCQAIVKAIESEAPRAFVPWWPWAWLRWLIKILPLSQIRKFS